MAKTKNKKEDRKISFKYNLSVYFNLLKNYKGAFIGALIFILILEASYVADKFLFKVIIDNGTSFVEGSLLRAEFVQILLIVLGIFISILIIRAFSNWIYIHLTNKVEASLIFDLKKKFFNHLVTLDHGFHVSHKTGSLISRLTRGGRAMERMTDILIFNVAPLMFQLVAVTLSVVYFSWIPALVLFLTVVSFISFNFLFQRIQQGANLAVNEAEDIEKANIADIFTNIDSIKYFGKEETIKKKFAKLSGVTRFWNLKHWHYFRWGSAGQSLILGLGAFLLILFPLIQLLNGGITIGTLVFIYVIYGNLVGPMFGFVHGMGEYYRAMADFEDLFQYGKIEKKVKDNPRAKNLEIKEGKIEFKNIDFNYGKRKIFKNFSLKIPKNKKVALVGHSGCGKTTLVKLLYRFYDVQEGSITTDGEDIRKFKQESLREEMSIVPQEAVLFDDTIYNNVAFSNPKASKKEVLKAIKFAQLDKIIKEFPKKEHTIVGERGVKLSGGEKQRVSIARAILANKKVLVLDEATSSLDSETEAEIQKDLEKLMKGRTSIIIAHRLSTIMHADIIVVMKKGKMEQIGDHRKLITEGGEYQRLWNLQKGGYIK